MVYSTIKFLLLTGLHLRILFLHAEFKYRLIGDDLEDFLLLIVKEDRIEKFERLLRRCENRRRT